MLHTIQPREQSGRDSFSRYKAQSRSAAIAALAILEAGEVDRVYCDLHDDFVVRKKTNGGLSYTFYQVKTKAKLNDNWSINEVFGIYVSAKKQSVQSADKIKDSFVGKLLLHTVLFGDCCDSVVFQTNIHTDDDIANLHKDIKSGGFKNKYSLVLIGNFNAAFKNALNNDLSNDEITSRLKKLEFETDVQYLKNGDHNFEPLAREHIYRFSEIDLGHEESKEILLKLLDLVEKKSCGVISDLTADSIEKCAGISIDDLLSILSISRDAYQTLVNGGDSKAIKSASIIQRTLQASGANEVQIEYCSRCKSAWDRWLMCNRHVLPEFELITIVSGITGLLKTALINQEYIDLTHLRNPILKYTESLRNDGILYDLTEELVLGGVFSELIRAKP